MTLLKRSSVLEKAKLKMYKTVIRPKLMYSCGAWSLTIEQEQGLEVFEDEVKQ